MKKYKLRAECLSDVVNLLKILKTSSFLIETMENNLPDVELTFITAYNFIEVAGFISKVEDSHVMLQSLNIYDHYTGERDENIYALQLKMYQQITSK